MINCVCEKGYNKLSFINHQIVPTNKNYKKYKTFLNANAVDIND